MSLGIFVDTLEEICLERGLARDSGIGKSREELMKAWHSWLKDENDYMERDKTIIEAIAITPEYAHWLQQSHPEIDVKAAFLIDRDKANIQKRLDERGLWDDVGRYPGYIKPIERKWTVLSTTMSMKLLNMV